MSPPRHNRGLKLSELAPLDRLVRLRCNYCRSGHRYYRPENLMTLLGDVEVDRLRGNLTCETCNRRDYIEIEAPILTAGERQGLVIRRLVKVRVIRRPVWCDESE